MKKILFKKYSGAGNDFILLNKGENIDIDLSGELIRNLCNRQKGIGADGLFILNNSEKSDFAAEFFNSDGNPGSLCGNGSRCLIKNFGISENCINNNINFEFNGSLFSGIVLENGNVVFNFSDIEEFRDCFTIEIDGQKINCFFINNGSPHVIIFVDRNENEKVTFFSEGLKSINVREIGKIIRNNSQFSPGGTNVNFVEIIDKCLHIRTFERGVEDETLACGTGSVASSLVAGYLNYLTSPVTVVPKSGDILEVNFVIVNNTFSNIKLTGPAELIFSGEFYLKT